ncbi:MAG: holo-ACP synthase [Leptolyngbya sp. SIO1E4]|nr:holo-ACP synthase [Leptolyngbya sp. SIO1E4]
MKAGYLGGNDNPPQDLLSSTSNYLEVIGHGIDIVETKGVQKLIAQLSEAPEMGCFTANERNVCELGSKRIEYFAGRLAAKQAVLKALGEALNEGASWLDIEIKRLSTGEPSVVLYDNCLQIAMDLGVTKWLLSISHESSYAAASAIALGQCSQKS